MTAETARICIRVHRDGFIILQDIRAELTAKAGYGIASDDGIIRRF